jgi:hypothetical protein
LAVFAFKRKAFTAKRAKKDRREGRRGINCSPVLVRHSLLLLEVC